jgi:hypothetical protein
MPTTLPVDSGAIRDDGTQAFTPLPDDRPFVKHFKAGLFTFGDTTIPSFVAAADGTLNNVSPSRLRVISAVSPNEGKFEAINSWDGNFMSIGIFQWTAGGGGDPGELAGFLHRLRTEASAAFQTYFGSFNLVPASTSTNTGHLILNGDRLDTAAKKAVLRSPLWAYRFWRAAHDDDVRACQVRHALGRIDRFYDLPVKPGRPVRQYLTSELGVSLVLDEHVNRPGHVPGTVAAAVDDLVGGGGNADPTGWTDADEGTLIDLYIQRRNQTNMTDPDKPADNVKKAVAAGLLSAARGSFKP